MINHKVKILITNSVPLNGGDEALLRATYLSLNKIFPNAEITVLCSKIDECRKYINDIKLDSDLEFLDLNRVTFKQRVNFKIRRTMLKIFNISWDSNLSLLFAKDDEARIKKLYKNCDLVISSAGGFLHDFYEIRPRIEGFKLALNYKKAVVLFSQSIGPFWKDNSKALVAKTFPKLSAIFLREFVSLTHLRDSGIPILNVKVTSDAAFLWRLLMPELFICKTGKVKTIAMCFRNWPLDSSNIHQTIEKAVQLCSYLLNDKDKRIIFLSTCQGIPGYVDDSEHAKKIKAALPEESRARCEIITKRHSPVDLIKEYSKCDAFIGMRLHGAILSMLGGTPAIGLGYEDKTKGIFSNLGLENYQVDFDDSIDKWKTITTNFLNDVNFIREKLPAALDIEANKAMESIRILETFLDK